MSSGAQQRLNRTSMELARQRGERSGEHDRSSARAEYRLAQSDVEEPGRVDRCVDAR